MESTKKLEDVVRRYKSIIEVAKEVSEKLEKKKAGPIKEGK